MDTSIEVPGIVPAPPVPWGIYLGLGAFFILLEAFLTWFVTASGDPSLWALPVLLAVVMAAFFGANLSTRIGTAGRIRLTRRKGGWAALGSRTAQLFFLAASILTLLITTGFIIALPETNFLVWLFGFIGLLGIADSAYRLRNPYGWYFSQYSLMVLVPQKGSATFSWGEVQRVELKGRVVVVTGAGKTMKNPGGDVASDPAVVAGVLEFYRANARLRPELSDDRFLERLRSGRL